MGNAEEEEEEMVPKYISVSLENVHSFRDSAVTVSYQLTETVIQ